MISPPAPPDFAERNADWWESRSITAPASTEEGKCQGRGVHELWRSARAGGGVARDAASNCIHVVSIIAMICADSRCLPIEQHHREPQVRKGSVIDGGMRSSVLVLLGREHCVLRGD